jgi:superfamily I DNA/RNA helicase
MAESDDTRTALYLAFNKVAATEAEGKMPDHVECRTTHSMAYAAFGAEYREKLSRPKGRGYVNVAGTVAEITRFFKVKNTGSLSANGISRMVKLTVAAFECSADPFISELNIPQHELQKLALKAEKKDEGFDKQSVVKHVLKLANSLWIERTTLHSPVLMTHDTYLKMYQLSKPVLEYDVIFLDEAQDTSDCVIDIVMGQTDHSQVVCVGDSFQAIYGWRGAVNALAKIQSQSTPLSQSFRYGPRVAAVATHILDGAMKVRGFDQLDTLVQAVDKSRPYVMLFRTNAALIEESIALINQGVNVLISVDTRAYVKKLEAAAALYKGDKRMANKQEDICVFEDWEELLEEAYLVKGELARIVKQVESGAWRKTVKTLGTYNKPWDADVTLTTAHKSKGMEYDQVVLADDFPDVMVDDEYHELNDMERNLIYVAATRAQGCLELNQTVLDIIEHRTEGDDRLFKDGFDIAEDRADMAGYVNDLLLDNEPPF